MNSATFDFERNLSRVIAKTWSDLDFKEKFLANPKKTLENFGILSGVETVIVSSCGDSSDDVAKFQGNELHINLPIIPAQLEDDALSFKSTEVLFCFQVCCTCLEIDPKLKIEA